MAEILSQAEIDELLDVLRSGAEEGLAELPSEEQSGTVRSYDFRTANRFTKDQMRSLTIVFETFGQLFANRVTNLLRVLCECEVLSAEEMGYNEFNNSLPSPVILGVFSAAPMIGPQLLQISPEVAYMIINRLLGGAHPSNENIKQFTEIELALIERFLDKTMHTYDEAWEKVLPVRARLERIETNTQFVQIAGLNDAVAVGTMSIRIGDSEGLFSLCIPRASIEGILGRLSSRSLFSTGSAQRRKRDEARARLLGERIAAASVTLRAYFNETPATVSDIVALQVGDVIRLRHKLDEPLLMKVQHRPKFYGKAGTAGGKYAIRITDIIEEGADEDDAFTS